MPILELLHFNDVHARFDGLARLAGRVREIRAAAPYPVLALDGGDIEDSGVELSALTRGVAAWRLLRAAGVDAAVVGNGGLLRYGPGVLAEYAAAFGAPPLLGDVALDGAALPGTVAARLVPAGDLTVGIIGITDWFTAYADFGLTELPRITEVCRHAAELREQGADVVVVLSHAGIDNDRALAQKLIGRVDLIVGGHSHTLLPDGEHRGNAIPIVQAGNFAEHLGRVRLSVQEGTVSVVRTTVEPVPADAPRDPEVLAELAACERDLADWLAEPVGMLRDAAELTEGGESAMVLLLTEAVRSVFPVDVAVLYPVHCAAGIAAGAVTRGDVWRATSSPGNAAVATLTGAQLREMLRRGAAPEQAARRPRAFRGRAFGYLHAVGLTVTGDRILVGAEPLDDARSYRVAGSDVELSPYGGLVDLVPADLTLDTSRIMPELLTDHLVARS
ncbi:bifunctional metallophosphatase/5'-nucleotidase [Actinocatenispora thailandica]|uniref:Bifunctional metallophosphatase/5'-nucleotidase n=1 Tax=Actinocatenispora thailandica TaxID=227318 RepID=A0A7R7DS88_9ACTN|nr:5'-nucleotidase C-terminal domain-containing protein [Actinocatenispora thailandica]BCJ36868.1 bifunctional metallophosphatase/5'-nucleotidase [Actinocatenispora thailandica]